MSSVKPAYDELEMEIEDLRETLVMRVNETDHALCLMREEQEEKEKAQAELQAERVKTNKLSHRLKCARNENTELRKKYQQLKVANRAAWKYLDKLRTPAAQPSGA